MANLKNIKQKIQSYRKTGTVTHAMEAVSAIKMRKSQMRALSGRAYAAAALSVLERISGTADAARHPMMQEREGMPLFIVITSDKGLAGSFNSGVIRVAEKKLGEFNFSNKTAGVLVAIGRRGGDYFASRGYDILLRRENIRDDVLESDMRDITDEIVKRYDSRDIGSVYVIYQNFISTFEQEPVVKQIVPIRPEMMREMVAGIRPAKGKYAPQDLRGETARVPAAYTIEPDPDTVLSELLPKLLNIAVFHALIEAKASEHSARMVAMKNATDKAKEMAHNLTRTFNKVRQAAITREVSEITSGIEAMK